LSSNAFQELIWDAVAIENVFEEVTEFDNQENMAEVGDASSPGRRKVLHSFTESRLTFSKTNHPHPRSRQSSMLKSPRLGELALLFMLFA
jgi:hypothetical protein